MAKMINFANFEMPLYYGGIVHEHLAVRKSVGIFDISHMGRVIIEGEDSERFLNYILTNDVSVLSIFGAQYSVMCNESGGIVDDLVTYRLAHKKFLMVYNAANRQKDFNWLTKNSENFTVLIDDVSDNVSMLAVQGPKAEETLQKLINIDLSKIGRFKCENAKLTNIPIFISRTGYTGEDGFEVFTWNTSTKTPENSIKVWNAILQAGKDYGIEPCGLGARDTLRLEAGMCLYGNDIDERTSPLEASLRFVVKLQKNDFIGKQQLAKQQEAGIKRRRVGIQMIDRGVPRPNFEIYDNFDQKLGHLTSGTFSPLLNVGIGMAYVPMSHVKKGTILKTKIRSNLVKGKIVSLPFYDKNKYGYTRKDVS